MLFLGHVSFLGTILDEKNKKGGSNNRKLLIVEVK